MEIEQDKSKPEESGLRSRSILEKGEKRNILCKRVTEVKKIKFVFLAGANVPYDQCPGEGSLHRRQGDNDFEKDESSKVSKLNAKSRDSSIDIEEETIKK